MREDATPFEKSAQTRDAKHFRDVCPALYAVVAMFDSHIYVYIHIYRASSTHTLYYILVYAIHVYFMRKEKMDRYNVHIIYIYLARRVIALTFFSFLYICLCMSVRRADTLGRHKRGEWN